MSSPEPAVFIFNSMGGSRRLESIPQPLECHASVKLQHGYPAAARGPPLDKAGPTFETSPPVYMALWCLQLCLSLVAGSNCCLQRLHVRVCIATSGPMVAAEAAAGAAAIPLPAPGGRLMFLLLPLSRAACIAGRLWQAERLLAAARCCKILPANAAM